MGLLRAWRRPTSGRRNGATGGVRLLAVSTIGGLRTGSLVVQDSVDPREATVFRAHAAPQGLCDNFTNSLRLLTNQQKDGDSSVECTVTGLLEKSRKGILDGLRKLQ